MATITNLNYNSLPDIYSSSIPPPPPPKPPSNCHCNNYTTTNLSNLSPIYEGQVFASPTNTISPSLSHNTLDNNTHVALFNPHSIKYNNIITNNLHDQSNISPTTSVSSSNSSASNTPTPTTYHTSNSLFNIPSTNNNPPCIPSVGLMSTNISKTSTSSSSPSPSLDTTVSPVTKMDLFRDLQIFENNDTDDNNTQIDYLTGDQHCTPIPHKKHEKTKIKKTRKKNKSKKQKKTKTKLKKVKSNINGSPYIINNTIESDGSYSSTSTTNTPIINGSNVEYNNNKSVSYNNIPPPPPPHSPLNNNSNDNKIYNHKKIKKHKLLKRKRKSNTKGHRRRKCESSYSDSDSELSKKGKIKDKIKKISIRVPGDPNGLYKYWKRTTAKNYIKKNVNVSPVKDCHLNIFSENKEENIECNQYQKILNIDESFKLSMNPLVNKINIKNRDRLNSYPPNTNTMAYTIESPSSSMSMSMSTSQSSNYSQSSMPNIKINNNTNILKKSQSCSNLLSSSIIIHTPTKGISKSPNINGNNKPNDTYNFAVLGLKNYTKNSKKRGKNKHKNTTPDPIHGYNIMKDYSHNRIRINSFPSYEDITDVKVKVPSLTDIIIERSLSSSPHHTPTINDDNKDEEWHYTSRKSHRKSVKSHYYNSSPYYYTKNIINNTPIPIYKWNDDNNNNSPSISRKQLQNHSIHPGINGKLHDL